MMMSTSTLTVINHVCLGIILAFSACKLRIKCGCESVSVCWIRGVFVAVRVCVSKTVLENLKTEDGGLH